MHLVEMMGPRKESFVAFLVSSEICVVMSDSSKWIAKRWNFMTEYLILQNYPSPDRACLNGVAGSYM